MLGAEGATRQGVSAPPPSCGSDRIAQIGASAPPKRNHRLRAGQARLSKLPRFGMSTKPASAAKIEAGGRKKTRVRAAVVGAGIGRIQLAACISSASAGDSELWVLLPFHGVNSYEGLPRSLFARRRSCALRASWGSAPDFAGLTVRRRHGQPRRRRSPCCSTKWSADSPKRCSAQIIFQRRLNTPSRPGALLSQKPRLPRCGNCERRSDLEVRPPSRWKICPPKFVRVFLRCLEPGPTEALGRGRRGSSASLRTKAVWAPFDNPSLSWNMTGARSLDYARG